jgi:exoribonuclease R
MPTDNSELLNAAYALLLEHGFEPSFSASVEREVQDLSPHLPERSDQIRDLRTVLWSSIDNPESRDLDQIEFAQRLPDETIRLWVGVADVDSRVPQDSAVDEHAALNTTSLYTGVAVFPMLPERLSTDLTSLNPGEERLAVVVELDVTADGSVASFDVFRALVRNQAKLDYDTIGDWLGGAGEAPDEVRRNPDLEQQIRWQDETAQRLRTMRRQNGTLNIETVEARPVVVDGKVIDLAITGQSRARQLIENFMVAANVAMAEFLTQRKVPAIRRVVRTPKRWDRIVQIADEMGEWLPPEPDSKALAVFLERRKEQDADNFPDLSLTVVKLLGAGEYVLERRFGGRQGEGHFGLAVAEYTHSTAPNRRYPDLIVQRLAKAALSHQPTPYVDAQLDAIARHCTEREDAARKIERSMRKKAAALLMSDRIGDSFAAIVTGASNKGTYVRLLRPPVEGRVTAGADGLDVGDTVRVRLTRVDLERGYIDFETETAARSRKLERSKRKKAAAARLVGRIGETFDAAVTGATEHGVWIRTTDGIEGRVMRGSAGLNVSQNVRVTLLSADAVHGFIDFERLTPETLRKSERASRKKKAAVKLHRDLGARLKAEVTGITRKATWIRTSNGTEGRLVRGWRGLQVGERIDVILIAADSARGYIDFARE